MTVSLNVSIFNTVLFLHHGGRIYPSEMLAFDSANISPDTPPKGDGNVFLVYNYEMRLRRKHFQHRAKRPCR